MISQIIGAIKERQSQIANSLAAGRAETFELYQRMVGEYLGLQHILQVIDDILREKDDFE